VFPLSLNEKDSEATEIYFPEAEVADEIPVFQKGLAY